MFSWVEFSLGPRFCDAYVAWNTISRVFALSSRFSEAHVRTRVLHYPLTAGRAASLKYHCYGRPWRPWIITFRCSPSVSSHPCHSNLGIGGSFRQIPTAEQRRIFAGMQLEDGLVCNQEILPVEARPDPSRPVAWGCEYSVLCLASSSLSMMWSQVRRANTLPFVL